MNILPMNTTQEVLIPNVTPEQFARLTEMIRDEGGVVSGANAGLVENACFAAKFEYNDAAKLLMLEPLRLVQSLTPRRLRKTVEQMIAPPQPPTVLDSGTIYKPTPHSCATYNWAIGFFTNNSGGVLTYSGSSTPHGYLDSYVPKINPGDTPETHKDTGFWVNKDGKDATNGCEGWISYQLADGVTTLTVTYYVNTESSTSATAALSGQNAARYLATCDKYTSFYYAAAYLYPYVTLDKV